MRISRIGAIETAALARHSTTAHETEISESHALVAIEPPAPHPSPRAPARHPAAPFLAQVIATHLQAPQTRTRRRAEPEEAIAAYRSALKVRALRRA
jgi:hypothetical protein